MLLEFDDDQRFWQQTARDALSKQCPVSLIREIECMDRGRYAGPVGWFDRHGDGEFGIALRCASVDVERGEVRSYAGCGIVAGSDPVDELAESVAKLVPIRDALELR